MKKYSSNKNYSPAKVKSQNVLTNISYNRLKGAACYGPICNNCPNL